MCAARAYLQDSRARIGITRVCCIHGSFVRVARSTSSKWTGLALEHNSLEIEGMVALLSLF